MKKYIIVILIIFLTLIALLFWPVEDPLDNVYETREDKIIAQFIEKTIETAATKFKNFKSENLKDSIILNSLNLEINNIDKACYAGPYGDLKHINKIMGFEWKYGKEWESNVLFDDSKFSLFLVKGNKVIPINLYRVFKLDNIEFENEASKLDCLEVKPDKKVKISVKNDKDIKLIIKSINNSQKGGKL